MISELMLAAFQVIGPCSDAPLLTKKLDLTGPTVGHATVQILEDNRIPFLGNERGMNSIFNTPVGLDSLEIISDNEMRSYGWCFEVDGAIPDVYADEIPVESVRNVTWFYGYSHYLNGEWVSMCEKAFIIKPAFLCK